MILKNRFSITSVYVAAFVFNGIIPITVIKHAFKDTKQD